ncbi:MAG: ribokinase [Sphaerochaetaceae bacterium]
MKILDIGSLNVDNTYRVEEFPKPGETKSSLGLGVFCGGKGLNQSVAAAKAGCEVLHAGYFGEGSGMLREALEGSGVDVSLMRPYAGMCGHTVIEVDRHGQNCILLYGGSNKALTKEYIDAALSACGGDDVLLLQNEVNLVGYAMEAAHRKGMRIAFNAAPMDDGVRGYPLSLVTWLFVNEVEGAALSGEEGYPGILAGLRREYPATAVVLTLGKRGLLYGDPRRTVRMGTYADAPVVDTTAAGDTFVGFFLAGVSKGWEVERSLRFATAASSICIGRPGAFPSIPYAAEVEDALEKGTLGTLR